MAVSKKTQRIELRVSTEAKKTIEDAARLLNVSTSSYIFQAVLKQTHIDLSLCKKTILNNIDRDALIKELDNPPEPNEDLKKLF